MRLTDVLFSKVLLADGAMGTMLQAADIKSEDFEGLEGCNEVLNRTRPDVVKDIHRAYFEAGSDLVETNSFGTNLAALAEYGIEDQIDDLAFRAAKLARETADEFSTEQWPRFVLGSVGPGTKLPTLGQIDFTDMRDAYYTQISAMIRGGIDAVQIETAQDLLQAKAAVIAAKRARSDANIDLPIFVSVTVETTGTMLLGSEIGAALCALEPLGVDILGLNCATGPTEMREYLRYLSRNSKMGVSAMPNAGLPQLTSQGAVYDLTPDQLAKALSEFIAEDGLCLVGGCCGTTPEHIRMVREAIGDNHPLKDRVVKKINSVSSLYSDVPLKQDTSYLTIGERTNANGSKAFREAMLEGNWDECLDIARGQLRQGAHVLDLCVDYVGRDGSQDMSYGAAKFATSVTLPLMLDSTEPAVIEAGLNKLAGRCIVNSVNYEDGDGPDSRFNKMMKLVSEHGSAVVALTIDETGQARTADHKVEVAERLIKDLTENWGMDEGDILVDCLTFPIATGADETRRDGIETIEAIRRLKESHPRVGTTLGLSNISFGLNPAARVVLNSVFLDECVKAGLDSAIVSVAKIMPLDQIEPRQVEVALDLIYDRRKDGYDPLSEMLTLFENVSKADVKAEREAKLSSMPLNERLGQRIIDGNDKGLEDDLDLAMKEKEPIEIINEDLLSGMKTVGELFGAGKMQLPFVLAAAETMKRAVAYLEPHMTSDEQATSKGTLVLATVKGDVHDIGKNLVDIIVSNNGYTVVNLGIKQPISSIVEAAEKHHADAIGMSGLLVKSTMVMRDNLEELNVRGLSKYPVILGGAALTRTFVDEDLTALYKGTVKYAKDAFEGLTLMNTIMDIKAGKPGAELPEPRKRRVKKVAKKNTEHSTERSEVARGVPVPEPPFYGNRVLKGMTLSDVVDWLDEKATLMGRWGLRGTRDGMTYEQLAQSEGRPRLRGLLETLQSEKLLDFGVVYGYYPCFSEGEDLIVCDPDTKNELFTWTFPRQNGNRRLCIPDFFRDRQEAEKQGLDVIGLQIVTIGSKVSEKTAEMYAKNEYRAYLEMHGLSCQLAEALAEWTHHRIRQELGIAGEDGEIEAQVAKQAYQGSRYSFGYGACPDLHMRRQIVDALDAERIGVHLSEEYQLDPEQSTDAFVVHHKEAKYFSTMKD